MNPKIFINLLSIILFCFSCAKNESQKSIIKEKSLDLQVYEAYSEGKKSLEEGDVLYAAKKFNEAEVLFPQSRWASKSALMAAYSYYIQDYYGDAISELNRFVKIYPNDPNLDYANYLLGICYYEQIVDEKKDTQSILQAQEVFNFVIKNYPNSDYALDADYKLELIDDYKINGDFIESQAFAYLAIRSLLKLPISFPNTTGCDKPTTGGSVIKFK